MAEKKEMRIENIKKASEILKDGKLDELVKSAGKFESDIKNVKTALEEKLKALPAARKEREAAEADMVFTQSKHTAAHRAIIFFICNLLKKQGGPAEAGPPELALAAEAEQLAKDLPDIVAVKVTHIVDLLISICLAKTGILYPICNHFASVNPSITFRRRRA